jgi:integrase
MLEGTYLDPKLGRIPFREWVDQWWATTMHLRPSSRSRNEGILRNQLVPRFGDRPLISIRPTDVRAFVSELAAEGFAPGSVRKVYNVLRAILKAAEESGLIGRSPCVAISLPPPDHREMRFLNPEEILRLANEAPVRFQALIVLAAYGGLRFGELAGLRADRIDFLRSRLTVSDAIVEVGGKLHHGPTKTGPNRVVTLPRSVIEAVAAHLSTFPPGPNALVFTDPDGGPVRRSNFRHRVFLPAVRDAGLRPLRFHDLRHTAAALAIKAGAHPKAIAERLGHASITTTLNTYGHLFPALDEELAGRLDDMARESGVARLWHERSGNVVAIRDRDANWASDQGVSPWALVVSNHRPPPCKGGALPLS